MTNSIINALRLLAHFWLEEVKIDDADTVIALPELADTLPQTNAAALTDLAVEYQRLFGFNLPPYESIFIDPSAMLMAPATERVKSVYQQANWTPPAGMRTGAPDHLGLELLALADGLDAGQTGPAHRLHTEHLALWVPAFALALQRLSPHPFYATLADLSVDLLLSTLPEAEIATNRDPFPVLPPPPVYRGTDEPPPASPDETKIGLRNIVKKLLLPCQAGLFITREDIAHLGQTLDLPGTMGERLRMLESLFRLAGQYELVPALLGQLKILLNETGAAYRNWATEYPAWTIYAQAWRKRLSASQNVLEEIGNALAEQENLPK
jgi:TorA maturation chaperone TorD